MPLRANLCRDPSESRAPLVDVSTHAVLCHLSGQWIAPGTDLDASENPAAADAAIRRIFEWKPILRKEVIQPHLPIRLPCYDFVPLAPHTFGGWLPHHKGASRTNSCKPVGKAPF